MCEILRPPRPHPHILGIAVSEALLSIAVNDLYQLLQSQNCVFRTTNTNFSYADGVSQQIKALETDVKLSIGNKLISMTPHY